MGRCIQVPALVGNRRAARIEDRPDEWPRRVPASIRCDPLWQYLRQRDSIDVIRRLDAIGLLDEDERAAWAPLMRDRDE
jgi:hypothetical protein